MFIDLRFFVFLYIIVMAVSAAKTSMNFYLSRKERSANILKDVFRIAQESNRKNGGVKT